MVQFGSWNIYFHFSPPAWGCKYSEEGLSWSYGMGSLGTPFLYLAGGLGGGSVQTEMPRCTWQVHSVEWHTGMKVCGAYTWVCSTHGAAAAL